MEYFFNLGNGTKILIFRMNFKLKVLNKFPFKLNVILLCYNMFLNFRAGEPIIFASLAPAFLRLVVLLKTHIFLVHGSPK